MQQKSEVFSGRPCQGYTNSLLTKGYISDYTPSQVFLKNAGHAALKVFKEIQTDTYCLRSIFEAESDHLHSRLREIEGKPVDVKAEFGMYLHSRPMNCVFDADFVLEVENSQCGLIFGDPLSWVCTCPLILRDGTEPGKR